MNMKQLKELIYLYLEEYPSAMELFYKLGEAGDIYLIGGIPCGYSFSKY